VSLTPGYEDDPLHGDRPIDELRTGLHSKAFIAARRHLFEEHGFTRAQLRTRSGHQVLEWHLDAHGLTDGTSRRAGSRGGS
jgi:hypothetical protein